ncbi:MAG: TetR/AcrR family transcriptional regulator [Deltaproteobacteria bacterium]|nr:TetR/AcrR family transcriptional regulator [Deltaproteobacteria bacterium]PWB62483.1 MAG: TetR/AcrR family transcriptional regulator [Deltaproteobacteria bacterium]
MNPLSLPRREREKLRQREDMLAAALELFSQKGYHNVSMHEIALKAEFAIGTLYKFFRNKEDLYKALVLEQSDRFHDAFERAIETPGDEVEILRHYVRTKGEMFRANLPFIRLYIAESRGVGYNIKAGLTDEVRKRHYEFLERLALVFDSGIRRNRFRKVASPYQLAVALDTVVNAFLLLWIEAPELHPYQDTENAVLDIFFEGLIARDFAQE